MPDVRVKVLKRFNDLAAGAETHLDAAVAEKWAGLGLLKVIDPEPAPAAQPEAESPAAPPESEAAAAPPENAAAKAPKVRK